MSSVRERVSRHWVAKEASEICLGYWCNQCENIIPKMNYHIKYPEKCNDVSI